MIIPLVQSMMNSLRHVKFSQIYYIIIIFTVALKIAQQSARIYNLTKNIFDFSTTGVE